MTYTTTFRAVLAFLLLQALGSVYVSHMASDKDSSSIFATSTDPALFRFYTMCTCLLAVVRFCLMCVFDCYPLHICHLAVSLLYIAHVGSELYYFQSLLWSMPNIFTIVINSFVFLGFAYSHSYFCEAQTPQPNLRRGRGRLFASHYMESDVIKPANGATAANPPDATTGTNGVAATLPPDVTVLRRKGT